MGSEEEGCERFVLFKLGRLGLTDFCASFLYRSQIYLTSTRANSSAERYHIPQVINHG